MLASPCSMHGSLAFGCMLLCKGALGLYYLCPSISWRLATPLYLIHYSLASYDM